MKKNAKTIIFMLAAFFAISVNVNAKSSLFTQATSFDLDNIEQNLLNVEPQNRYTLTITNRAKWAIYEVMLKLRKTKEMGAKNGLRDEF